jgi:dipeptidyl aminopeptidase/acylaminoacyl peptidase
LADSKVEHARAHFGPRYTGNGVTLSDFTDVAWSVEHWDDWCRAWSGRASVHESMGREALEAKQFVSAAEHLNRAAACYHFGKYLFVQDLEQMRAAHEKSVACYSLALPHFDFPGERVFIPYEGGHLVGVLRFPAGASRSPLVIMCNGLDSAKEELDSSQVTFLRRGMATLVVDGPGQGEAEYDFPIRADYETVVGLIIDWVSERRDIDTDRIGLWGISLGGYYAPRAAAYEKRIKACIALGGPYDWGALWDNLSEFATDCFRVRSKSVDNDEAKRKAVALTLRGSAERIECPLFIVSSGLDRLCPPSEAERLASEARGPVELLIIPDGNHVAHNRAYRYRPQTADWMAHHLGVTST